MSEVALGAALIYDNSTSPPTPYLVGMTNRRVSVYRVNRDGSVTAVKHVSISVPLNQRGFRNQQRPLLNVWRVGAYPGTAYFLAGVSEGSGGNNVRVVVGYVRASGGSVSVGAVYADVLSQYTSLRHGVSLDPTQTSIIQVAFHAETSYGSYRAIVTGVDYSNGLAFLVPFTVNSDGSVTLSSSDTSAVLDVSTASDPTYSPGSVTRMLFVMGQAMDRGGLVTVYGVTDGSNYMVQLSGNELSAGGNTYTDKDVYVPWLGNSPLNNVDPVSNPLNVCAPAALRYSGSGDDVVLYNASGSYGIRIAYGGLTRERHSNASHVCLHEYANPAIYRTDPLPASTMYLVAGSSRYAAVFDATQDDVYSGSTFYRNVELYTMSGDAIPVYVPGYGLYAFASTQISADYAGSGRWSATVSQSTSAPTTTNRMRVVVQQGNRGFYTLQETTEGPFRFYPIYVSPSNVEIRAYASLYFSP